MSTPSSATAARMPVIDPLLVDSPGHREHLMGNEALVRGALEAGVGFAAGYPGTPSSEVTDSLARVAAARDICFEYSINEKIALEMAFAASLAGVRSICAMKHLGLMVAGDPLSTIPYMGVVGGMVIVSAGDPSCHTSPNEQDQRHLGPMLHLPVLDPATPAEALSMARLAFELSEQSELPVLLRITARVCHSRAVVRYGPLGAARPAHFEKNPSRFIPMPAHARALRQQIPARLERARARMDAEGLFRLSGAGKQAIVASGSPVASCRDLIAQHGIEGDLLLAAVGGPHPLPTAQLAALLEQVDRVLVVEELSPFIEDALCALAFQRGLDVQILGKRTGHLPVPFEYEPEVIQRAIHSALRLGPAVVPVPADEPLPGRPPILCPGCPHRATYYAARAAFGDEQLYFNDIGCYTLGAGLPLDTADALLCMGAGFTLAAGVGRVTGQRTVGFMGDSTFFHAGMPALLNAIQQDVSMVAVILDNQITAMTGFQQSPTATMGHSLPAKRADIEAVVRALGAEHVEKMDPANLGEAIAAFERAREQQGVSVIIAEHACPVHESRQRGGPLYEGTYEIDQSRCQSCGRQSCALRCELDVTVGQERHMARSRSLELYPGDGGPKPAPAAVARCAQYCPLALCIQGYAGHIAAGQYAQALELIMSRNPLPDSVCRVCHRPCESACVRAGIDAPVAINDLKRFVMDWAAEQLPPGYQPTREPEHGRSVAIVGAGPSGLAAAHELGLRGYRVTLLDAAEQAGGLLRYGIPRFRLPLEALDRDIARILALGVRFEGGQRLGRDFDLDALVARDFDAVFLAIGAGRSLALGLDGGAPPDGPEVVDALEYLATAGERPAARRVVVIGGGNAAIDAARTAARRGADTVLVAYRRSRKEMPALADEVEAAIEEGVGIRLRLAPMALSGGSERSLLCQRTEPGPADESGRRRPVPVPGTEVRLEADRVIVAIGQTPALELLAIGGAPLERDEHGRLRTDPLTGQSSHPQIFAGGDLSGGPRTVTDAIAAGQRAAWGIDLALRGGQAASVRTPPPHPEHWNGVSLPGAVPATGRVDQRGRALPPEQDPATRTDDFAEVFGSLDEQHARAEARRCMVCGTCGNCRACIDLFGCPAFGLQDGQVHIDPQICTACGMCAALCPNGAIVHVPATKAARPPQS